LPVEKEKTKQAKLRLASHNARCYDEPHMADLGALSDLEAAVVQAMLDGKELGTAMIAHSYSKSYASNIMARLRKRYGVKSNGALVLELSAAGLVRRVRDCMPPQYTCLRPKASV
jgi:hypothetical protein